MSEKKEQAIRRLIEEIRLRPGGTYPWAIMERLEQIVGVKRGR